jgi:hypothetical protein
VVNTLARPACIRNRTVPGPNGTSIGAAEVPFPSAGWYSAAAGGMPQYWQRQQNAGTGV